MKDKTKIFGSCCCEFPPLLANLNYIVDKFKVQFQ